MFGEEVVGVVPTGGRGVVGEGLVGGGNGEHLADGLDAADGVFGESPAVGDRADHFILNVDGGAGHAGDDAGVFETEAGAADEDGVLSGREVFHDVDDFDIEAFDFSGVHDGEAVAFHAGLDFVFEEVAVGVGVWELGGGWLGVGGLGVAGQSAEGQCDGGREKGAGEAGHFRHLHEGRREGGHFTREGGGIQCREKQ